MINWYDRTGKPITSAEANTLFGDKDYNRVGLTRITSTDHPGDEWVVSTVWLGLDHSWGDGPPVIFETHTFGPEGDPFTDNQDRYTTEGEARIGHTVTVSTLYAAINNATMTEIDEWPTEEQQ